MRSKETQVLNTISQKYAMPAKLYNFSENVISKIASNILLKLLLIRLL